MWFDVTRSGNQKYLFLWIINEPKTCVLVQIEFESGRVTSWAHFSPIKGPKMFSIQDVEEEETEERGNGDRPRK